MYSHVIHTQACFTLTYGGITSNCDWHKQSIKQISLPKKEKCAASPSLLILKILLGGDNFSKILHNNKVA